MVRNNEKTKKYFEFLHFFGQYFGKEKCENAVHRERPVSRDEALDLIGRMPDIETLHVKNEKLREQEYKECISGYSPEDWVRVLKTAYARTKSRGSITSVDKKYQMMLEHALFSEFSYALGMPRGQVPGFIAEYVKPEWIRPQKPES